MNRHHPLTIFVTRAVGVLGFLTFAAQSALRPDTFLARRDIYRLYLPLRAFLANELNAGRVPTWNPLDGLGGSLLGTALPAALHPMQLLLFVAPPDVALKLQVLACLVFAGVGAGLLARRLGGAEAGWWLAGLAYGGSGYLVSITDNFPYLHGAAVLPWVLLFAERLADQPTARRGLALGAVLALGVYGGDVQGTLLACLLAAGWAFRARRSWPVFGALSVAALLTVLLTAPLLPAIADTALDSGRAAGLRVEDIYLWTLSPVRLLELAFGPLVPLDALDFHGVLLARPLGSESGAFWSASELVGVSVLALAPLGLLRGAAPSARRYAVLALLGLLLSLGRAGLLYPLFLRFFPGWGAFRYPEKLMPFAVLGLALLAARGLVVPIGRGHRVSALVLALLCLPFAAWLDADAVTRAYEALRTTTDALPLEVAEYVAEGLRSSASLALLGCFALALTAWRWPGRLGWVAVAVLALQIGWCSRGLISTRPREELARTPRLLPAALEAGAARTRLAAYPERYSFKGQRFAATEAAAQGDLEALAPDHNMRFGLGNLAPYTPGSMGELERACSLRPACTSACARRLGGQLCIVSPELVQPTVDRGAVVLASIDQPKLTLLRDPKARALLSVPGVRPLTAPASLRDAFMQDQASLPALLPDGTATFDEVPGAVTTWTRPRPEHLEVTVTLPSPNMLVVAEHCARGWVAQVDDAPPVTPLRVDGGLCAVNVPAGTHQVTLRYTPPGWPWAWGLFSAGLMLGVATLLRARRDATASPEKNSSA